MLSQVAATGLVHIGKKRPSWHEVRLAKIAMNGTGRCWVTRIGTPSLRGKFSKKTPLGRRRTEFAEFPMAADMPDYPAHWRLLPYLRDYARHFDLYRHYRFGTELTRAEQRWENEGGDSTIDELYLRYKPGNWDVKVGRMQTSFELEGIAKKS